MSSDGGEYFRLSGRFEDTEFIGNTILVLGVPFDAPDEFKRRVWSAALSYVDGNRSMDYYFKRYGHLAVFPQPDPSRVRLSTVFQKCRIEVDRVAAQLANGVEREAHLGLFAAESALMRLKPSFEYASFLLMQGATYESAAILRLCLEQVAWAYDIHEIDDRTIFDKNPTRSISKLKNVESRVGRLYSHLSDYTHIQPRLQREYIDFSGEYAAVRFRDFEAALEMSNTYIEVVDVYVAVTEYVSRKYFSGGQAWLTDVDGKFLRNRQYTSCDLAEVS
ncbi:hypothetical protein [Stenotrophomonas maltophilia]|uniref:hypothetical protein n=2 Tax=Lysobacteraceae TaxID=32033 RepID=UPI000A56CE54|nr:hypothetical protein [Stenotrophomonas maltophilia]MCU1028637.1 hypothetical protein [Stenotrophomonas maltophilia]